MGGGATLEFGAAVAGCRAYLAVAGGLDVPVVLGARGTCLRTGIGGWEGRALRAGDRLAILPGATASPLARRLADQAGSRLVGWTRWSAGRPIVDQEVNTIRVLPGRQFMAFSQVDRESFLAGTFTVSAQSDRMGYRLAGPSLRSLADRTILSEAMVPGAIQVPPGGNPIVLMADGPVTGGYPVIGQVIAVDSPLLAQLRVDARIRFQQVNLSEARSLYLEREAEWARLQAAVALRK
jgi:antagonist of KipI